MSSVTLSIVKFGPWTQNRMVCASTVMRRDSRCPLLTPSVARRWGVRPIRPRRRQPRLALGRWCDDVANWQHPKPLSNVLVTRVTAFPRGCCYA